MKRICLVTMPFAALEVPSLALTQLEAVLRRRFAGELRVEVHYLNHEFVDHVGGLEVYQGALTTDALTAGLGDWFFRPDAFPGAPDNQDAFFRRYFYRPDGSMEATRQTIRRAQGGLEAFLDELVARHDLAGADLVGFTAFFAQTVASLAMARRIKAANPGVLTAMGGPCSELGMGHALIQNVEDLDFVFSGPALVSFPAFVEAWRAGDEAALHRIDGVYSRRNVPDLPAQGRAPAQGPGDPPEDGPTAPDERPVVGALGAELPLDESVPLDHGPFLDLFESRFPDRPIEPVLFFETSRGCWWGERSHCSFCGLNGGTMAYRAMDPERAVAQFRELFGYADRCGRLDGVDNIMPRSYLEEVLPRLDTPADMRILYEVRADLRDAEMAALAAANVRVVQPGIESLETSTLRRMGKGTTAFRNLAFLRSCLRHDIQPVWNLLVGFPGEGEESYRRLVGNLPSLVHLPPPSGVFPVRFDRFSPYFTHPEEHGLELVPFDSYGLIYPFDPASIRELAYYFRDARGGADYLVALSRWLERMQAGVAAWRDRWHGAGSSEAPLLHMLPGGAGVLDTRTGTRREHDPGPTGRAVLEALEEPSSPEALAGRLGLSATVVEAELTRLAGWGLVFQEGGRHLSLVLPEAPTSLRYIHQRQPAARAEAAQRDATPPPRAAPLLVRRDRRARRVRLERE